MENLINYLKPRVIDFIESDTDECLPFPNIGRKGYGDIQYSIKNKHGHYLAHRLVFQIKHNVILSKKDFVLHVCDNPICCNPKHLIKGTCQDNVNDMVSKGRQAKGSKNGRYKDGYYSLYERTNKPELPFERLHYRSLTYELALTAKIEINKGQKSLKEISKSLGVKYHVLKDIKRERSYSKL